MPRCTFPKERSSDLSAEADLRVMRSMREAIFATGRDMRSVARKIASTLNLPPAITRLLSFRVPFQVFPATREEESDLCVPQPASVRQARVVATDLQQHLAVDRVTSVPVGAVFPAG